MTLPTPTPNLKLQPIEADRKNWSNIMNDDLKILDAIVGSYFVINNLQGIWTNSTSYTVGQAVIDTATGGVFACAIAHTSVALPSTFLADRILHPTFWTAYSSPARARGAWTSGTNYAINDFVVSGSQFAIALQTHTSSALFATDLAAGKWSVLVDLSTAGSLVLPVLSGLADQNKFVVVNALGNGYTIVASAAALTNLGATSIGVAVLQAVSQAAARSAIGEGTASTKDVGTAALNVVQLDAASKLPAVDGSQLTGFIASQIAAILPGASGGIATTLLGADVAMVSAGVYVNGPNTGSIGANGQKWLIFAGGTFINNAGGNDTVTLRIFDGTFTWHDGSFSLTTGFSGSVFLAAIVTLTGAATFTLQASSAIGGSTAVLKTGGSTKSTLIGAVRIS